MGGVLEAGVEGGVTEGADIVEGLECRRLDP